MAVALRDKVTNALSAVDQFSALMEQETAALQNSDYALFENLQDRKYQLAQSYQEAILAFEDDIEALPEMEDFLKDKLRDAHVRFTTSADTNQRALIVQQKISERILNLIMTAAKQTVSDGPSYSASGHHDLSAKIPVHFNLNEQI
jgi:hypothetical protein